MVTDLYLLDTTAEEPKPNTKQSPNTVSQWIASTLGGGQDSASVIYPLNMKTSKGAATNTISQILTELGTSHYCWFKAWVSPKLNGNQTISGTLTVVFDTNEDAAGHNLMPNIRVYVWKGDDTGVRGLLFDASSSIESDLTDGTKQTFFNAVTLTSVNALDGDVIVIEVLGYCNNTKTLNYLHKINFADSGTASDSYIEFSQNITFVTEYVIVERSVTEPAISVSDSPTYNIRRDISILEPAVSISDAVERAIRRDVQISEPSISVSDSPERLTVKQQNITEPSISVSDAVSFIFRRDRAVSEPAISVSDLTERAIRRILELSESLGAVSDSASAQLVTPLMERNVSEPSINISDLPTVSLRRVRQLTESLGSVSDAVQTQFVKLRSVAESLGYVFDGVLVTADGKILLRLTPKTKKTPLYLGI